MKIPMPDVPVIHADILPRSLGTAAEGELIQRSVDIAGREAVPDRITGSVCVSGRGVYSIISLTPAELIGICNTMLTDEERAFINLPAPSTLSAPVALVERVEQPWPLSDDDILGIYGENEYAKNSRFVYRRPLGTLSDPTAWRIFCGVDVWNEHLERELMEEITDANDALIPQGGAA